MVLMLLLREERKITMLEREVKVHGVYKHFKGHVYEVIGIARDSDTLDEKVVYKNIETGELWLRDVEEFLSLVDKNKYPDVEQKYRFELLEEGL